MPEHGDLAAVPFPLLLARHYKTKSTGAIEISAGPFKKTVFLKDGGVIFAASNDHNDRLGELLLRRGIIRVPDHVASSALLVKGKRYGTVLVEQEVISPSQLVWAVKEQVKEIAFSLFALPAGPYRIVEEADAGEELITLSINTPELLRQGVDRMDAITGPLSAFDSLAMRLEVTRPPAEIVQPFELTAAEIALVQELGKTPRLGDLFEKTDFPHFALLKFLWVLLILDMIRPVSEGGEMADDSETPEELGITGEDLSDLF